MVTRKAVEDHLLNLQNDQLLSALEYVSLFADRKTPLKFGEESGHVGVGDEIQVAANFQPRVNR